MKEDTETLSMAVAAIELPVIVAVAVGGKTRSLNLAAIPETERTRIVGHLVARGLKISLDNPYSTAEGSAGDKDAAAHKRLVSIQDGTFSPGGGGGGSRLTPEMDAWIEYLQAKGEKKVSGKTLEACQVSRLAAILVNKGKAKKENAVAAAKADLPNWIKWMEENDAALKTLIAGKRALVVSTAITDDYPG